MRREHKDSMYRVKVYRGPEGLNCLEINWRKIADARQNVSFYQRYEWYQAYLEYLEEHKDNMYFFYVAETDSRNPVAIVPLKRQFRTYCGLRLAIWETPITNEIDLYDIISTDRNCVIPAFQAVLEKLRSDKELRFDAIFLDRVMEKGDAWNLVIDTSMGYKLHRKTRSSKYLACVAGQDGSEVIGNSKFRKNLRRLERRLGKRGEIEYDYVQDKKNIQQVFQQFLTVEASGWKGDSGTRTAIKFDAHANAFYRKLSGSFGELGRFRINFLRLNGDVIAAQYCLLDDTRINLLKIGHDSQYQDCSPGFLLIKKVFEGEIGSGRFNEMSFVTGSEWNDIFKPETLDVFSIKIFDTTIKGRVAFFASRLKGSLKR